MVAITLRVMVFGYQFREIRFDVAHPSITLSVMSTINPAANEDHVRQGGACANAAPSGRLVLCS